MGYTETSTIARVTFNANDNCQKISLSFTASATTGKIRWYNNAAGCTIELYTLTLYKR